ncbi:M1 family metallopeptidase [Jiulongibacter sediminis]|jgi:hypothetical protein|uniref:M1 family metallopeptidase n=1 Tax=Jiulongibacter sediminis TaxID=1605367 RepID=UPI0026E93E6C|nr:M1 family metallopeptidase [Jiulongibacter sediminis]
MKYILSLLALTIGLKVSAQNLAPDIANYTISVQLDTEKKQLQAEEILEWTNTSPVPVSELQFHLYLNAFKDSSSTFMKESGGKLRGDKMPEDGYGNIYMTTIKDTDGNSLLGSLKYLHPDDQNEDDRTVAAIQLKKPVQPGETVRLNIAFRAELPRIFARTGYGENDYYLIGQWFPKVGVFEQNKDDEWGWNCHQFHANSEFYSDFGRYKVSITVARNLTVGATGKLTNQVLLKNNLKTLVYEADDVHDFAWTASPDFVVHEKTWKGVRMKAMMQPEHSSQYKRYFDAAEKSLEYTEELLGKYPHKTLTMVDPPVSASGSGGMEYPTFITCGSYWGVGKSIKMAEIVTVHEFGHQYFQGILASNEFEQSFMDEGFNQYLEGRIMDEMYGDGSQVDLLGFKVGDMATSRGSYVSMKFPELAEINQPVWEYPKGTYGVMTYTKTATALKTLENYMGRELMDKALKAYYQRFKFKHPKLFDFVSVVNEVSGKDYNWYFDQTFEKSYSCDYSVDSIQNKDGKSYLKIKRKGNLKLPQVVSVTFADGSTEVFSWDPEETYEDYRFDKEIYTVEIDPQRKNLMDLNLLNNSYSVQPPQDFLTKYSAKAMYWLQHFVMAFLFWIG